MKNKGYTLIEAVIALALVVIGAGALALIVAGIYIAIHFLHKVW